MVRNPILRGFNPDPSICRVGQDYYIATSTFEWFPGVQIHHSRDLENWKLVSRPLNRADLLNMVGVPANSTPLTHGVQVLVQVPVDVCTTHTPTVPKLSCRIIG